MVANYLHGHRNSRVHAIILTRDRPETLRRCLALALRSLDDQDVLTILDDSTAPIAPPLWALITSAPHAASPTCIYLSSLDTRDAITQACPANCSWLSKTAPRDIAPLRNTALLLAAAQPAETTLLVDDDIDNFNLIATHHRLVALAKGSVIGGAHIGGISELDTVTRLAEAIDHMEHLAGAKPESPRNLFQVSEDLSCAGACNYVSGGYLAFRLSPDQMFAFPPGYNEDWLWCLLHRSNQHLQIVRFPEVVSHDPPEVRRPSRDDLLFGRPNLRRD